MQKNQQQQQQTNKKPKTKTNQTKLKKTLLHLVLDVHLEANEHIFCKDALHCA